MAQLRELCYLIIATVTQLSELCETIKYIVKKLTHTFHRRPIFLEQDRCFLTVYSRIGNSFRWTSIDYDDREQTFEVGGDAILVGNLYEKNHL